MPTYCDGFQDQGVLSDIRVCVFFSDGLFGQCRSSKHDQVQYQVTVPVLKRMQEVLKQLMLQGTVGRVEHEWLPVSHLAETAGVKIQSMFLSKVGFMARLKSNKTVEVCRDWPKD